MNRNRKTQTRRTASSTQARAGSCRDGRNLRSTRSIEQTEPLVDFLKCTQHATAALGANRLSHCYLNEISCAAMGKLLHT